MSKPSSARTGWRPAYYWPLAMVLLVWAEMPGSSQASPPAGPQVSSQTAEPTPLRTLRTFDRTSHPGLLRSTIMDLAEDDRGVLWIATFVGGLSTFDGVSIEPFAEGGRHRDTGADPEMAGETITAMALSPDGDVWFSTSGGLTTSSSISETSTV